MFSQLVVRQLGRLLVSLIVSWRVDLSTNRLINQLVSQLVCQLVDRSSCTVATGVHVALLMLLVGSCSLETAEVSRPSCKREQEEIKCKGKK